LPKKRPAKVVVKIDKSLQTLWKQLLAKLEKASSEQARDWDERYETIAAIMNHAPPVYLAGGYSTETAFIAGVVKEDRSTLYRNLRVARYANPADIARYGATKLDLAISLVEAKNGGPLKAHTPIGFDKLRCTFKEGDQVVTRPLAEVTVDQVRAAVALARGQEAGSKKASPAAKVVDAAVKKAGVKGVTFSVSKTTLTLRVPLEGVAKVARALSAFTPPK
jgi:hypothetical protein